MRARNRIPYLTWKVQIGTHVIRVDAKTPGAAAHQAFAYAIAYGWIKRQPRGDGHGGWDGVSIGLVR